MKFGLAGVNVGRFGEPHHALALASSAESIGIETLWAIDHSVIPAEYASSYPYSQSKKLGLGMLPIADPLSWLAFIAARTQQVRLATGVLILPAHNSVRLAKVVATIDGLSGGRFDLGIGVGWLQEEFDALGVPWDRRGARTDEYVRILRGLWTASEYSYEGEFVRLDRAVSLPKPNDETGVPIIVGGHTPVAAHRAGRVGDGFYPVASPERVGELVEIMRKSAADNDRDPDSIRVISGGKRTTDAHLIERYALAGVTHFVLPVPSSDPSRIDEALGELHDQLMCRFE